MNFKAILFMCNDFQRAKFTLENFCIHNPDISVDVINSGGSCPREYLKNISNKISFFDSESLWYKGTHCGRGSFGPKLLDYLCNHEDHDYVLYLETDVLTNRKITIEPKYDMAGMFSGCGPHENCLYDILDIPGDHFHTGCGGTIYSKKFCEETIKNKHLYYELLELKPENFYLDLVITLISKKIGLTVGYWEEVGSIYPFFNGHSIVQPNPNLTLIHGVKI